MMDMITLRNISVLVRLSVCILQLTHTLPHKCLYLPTLINLTETIKPVLNVKLLPAKTIMLVPAEISFGVHPLTGM